LSVHRIWRAGDRPARGGEADGDSEPLLLPTPQEPAPQEPAPQEPAPQEPDERPPAPSPATLRGLDWFIFFVADVQTGFGPFVSVYLTGQKWTQVDIGLVLSVGGLVALAGQIPGGALVDFARSERLVAGIAVAAIAVSALGYAAWPIWPIVMSAAVLHAAASCVLGPAIAAISLGLVGHAAVGERLGRNARFASIGNGLAAAAMGACGYFLSARAVFFVTALLLVPALLALRAMSANEIDPERAHGGVARPPSLSLPNSRGRVREGAPKFADLLRQRPLMILAGCVMLFHLANAAMLPLMAGAVTMRSSQWATVLIAICIVVPQLVVAALSPWVGRHAQSWGRRPLLLLGFAAQPLRGILFATVSDPNLLVAVQILDGLTASVFGVMVPLIIADLTRGTGHFNLGQGIVGTTTGIGASLSTTLAGYTSDHFGSEAAFLGLAAVAALGLAAVWLLLPETRPEDAEP
jgi:predicted MFS family arabinose efflux permease